MSITPHTPLGSTLDDYLKQQASLEECEAAAMKCLLAPTNAAPTIPAPELFPDSTPASVLRGARGLRSLTQAQLGAAMGVHPANISEMERGVRPIGKDMAKRLGQALHMPYKAFL